MLMKYVKRVFLTFCVKKVTSQLNRIVVLSIFKKMEGMEGKRELVRSIKP